MRKRSREQQRAIFAALRRRQSRTRHGLSSKLLLSAVEEKRLGTLAQHGSTHQKLAARNELVAANQKLVAHIANKYRHRGIHIKDLIQEGNFGLLKAAETYDPNRGTRFSTHATHWIKQSLGRAIESKGGEVRVPAEQQWSQNKLRKLSQKFYQTVGREPSIDELAHLSKLSHDQIRQAAALQFKTVSTNRQIGNSTDGDKLLTLEDTLLDDQYVSPYKQSNKLHDLVKREGGENRFQFLMNRLSRLSPIEKRVIANKYLEDKSDKMSGKELKLTRQRINQIERDALHKLRQKEAPKKVSRLKQFISSLRGKQ